MEDPDAIRRQLLNVIGVPAELHAGTIARQAEIESLRKAQRDAVAASLRALTDFYLNTLEYLPEGMSFTVEAD